MLQIPSQRMRIDDARLLRNSIELLVTVNGICLYSRGYYHQMLTIINTRRLNIIRIQALCLTGFTLYFATSILSICNVHISTGSHPVVFLSFSLSLQHKLPKGNGTNAIARLLISFLKLVVGLPMQVM